MDNSKDKVQTSLEKLKNDIEDSIKTINIPLITTESFSSAKLKEEIIPILEEGKKRISDVEHIADNIDAVRNEIINPVNEIIKNTSKPNLRFSIFSFIIGIIGIVLTINSYLTVNFSKSAVAKPVSVVNHGEGQEQTVSSVPCPTILPKTEVVFYAAEQEQTVSSVPIIIYEAKQKQTPSPTIVTKKDWSKNLYFQSCSRFIPCNPWLIDITGSKPFMARNLRLED